MNLAWPAFLNWLAAIPQPAFLWPRFLWALLALPLLVLLWWLAWLTSLQSRQLVSKVAA